MEALIVYIVIIFFVFRVIKKSKVNTEKDIVTAKDRQRAAQATSFQGRANTGKAYTASVPITSSAKRKKDSGVNPDMPVKIPGGMSKEGKIAPTLRDDRYNDWLARQMRDERNSLAKLREMFGFRMQGRGISDAELLKEFHSGHCDAGGVDRAQGK